MHHHAPARPTRPAHLAHLAALTALTAIGSARPSLAQCELDRPSLPAPADLDVFGWAVDARGPVYAFGAILTDGACPGMPTCDSGSLLVVERVGPGSYTSQVLTASDASPSDQFGQAVSLGDGVLVVGAHTAVEGAAYVFRRTGATWVEEQRLQGAGTIPMDHFGHAVGISGETIVVGVMRDTHQGFETGAAMVFENVPGTGWVQTDRIEASTAATGDRYGRAVEIDGDTIAVGALRHDGPLPNSGAVYVYERVDPGTPNDPSDDTWAETRELLSDAPAMNGNFGVAIALDGDTLLVGARRELTGPAVTGVVHVFERTAGFWDLVQKLRPAPGVAGEDFGESVAIDGDRILVGAPTASNGGRVHLFERGPGGWVETNRFAGADTAPGDLFGRETGVALSGEVACVGAPASSINGSLAGTAYVLDLNGCLGEAGCVPAPNSTGSGGALTARGSVLVSADDLTLEASRLPVDVFGLFVVARAPGLTPMAGGAGTLCLGGPIGRYNDSIQLSGPSGTARLDVDFAAVSTPNGPVPAVPGETLHFQFWHRDAAAGAPTSNFTESRVVRIR